MKDVVCMILHDLQFFRLPTHAPSTPLEIFLSSVVCSLYLQRSRKYYLTYVRHSQSQINKQQNLSKNKIFSPFYSENHTFISKRINRKKKNYLYSSGGVESIPPEHQEVKVCSSPLSSNFKNQKGGNCFELCYVLKKIVKHRMINCFHLITLITSQMFFPFCYLDAFVLSFRFLRAAFI